MRSIRSGADGLLRNIEPIECTQYDVKVIRFLNKLGGFEYIPFYQKDETKQTQNDQKYLQFGDYYKNVNGDAQDVISLFRDDYPAENEQILDSLSRAQNVWLADNWQISAETGRISHQTPVNGTITTSDRLVKMSLSDEAFAQVFDRFELGDRVSFINSETSLDMWGVIAQFSGEPGSAFVSVRFTETTGNDDRITLDSWIGVEDLNLVAWDAWQLCTFTDSTTINSGRGRIYVKLQLKTNPKQNYRI